MNDAIAKLRRDRFAMHADATNAMQHLPTDDCDWNYRDWLHATNYTQRITFDLDTRGLGRSRTGRGQVADRSRTGREQVAGRSWTTCAFVGAKENCEKAIRAIFLLFCYARPCRVAVGSALSVRA
jgi:hypothetical protein